MLVLALAGATTGIGLAASVGLLPTLETAGIHAAFSMLMIWSAASMLSGAVMGLFGKTELRTRWRASSIILLAVGLLFLMVFVAETAGLFGDNVIMADLLPG